MFWNFQGTNTVSQIVQKSYLRYPQVCELKTSSNFNWAIDLTQTYYGDFENFLENIGEAYTNSW